MEFEQAVKQASQINGWFNEDQMRLIHPYIASLPCNGLIVEIGTYRGRSTMFMALMTIAKIITIDPCNYPWGTKTDPAGFELVNDTIDTRALKAGNVLQIVGNSLDVEKTFNIPIDILLIDGDHSQVKADLDGWQSHVKVGGFILFHDYDDAHIEVPQAVAEILATGAFNMVIADCNMCIIKKIK